MHFEIAKTAIRDSSANFHFFTALQLTATITWACGVIKNKSAYLLISLVCWALPLAAFLVHLYLELRKGNGKFDEIFLESHISVYEVTGSFNKTFKPS